MSHSFPLRSTQTGRSPAKPPSPLRHASNASNGSESSSLYSSPFPPSRTSTLSSDTATDYRHMLSSHKRGISETSPTRSTAPTDYHYGKDQGSLPPPARIERQTLRQLPQAPNATPRPSFQKMPHRARGPERSTGNEGLYGDGASSPAEPKPLSELHSRQLNSVGVGRSDSRRTKPAAHATPPTSLLQSKELEQLGKSTTGHLRALSKFAEQQDQDEFTITMPEQEVAGMQGRRRLQRSGSTRNTKSAPGYGGRTWMDQQRQFLQAYEYLCHIGEAKEWIENVTEHSTPAIVQLEESLRDGVILAELVQAFRPTKPLRIFRNPKLQFRHSDNIAIFFRFVTEMDLPELFRFELVDLYEKKNIPKVIYCIHALSWLCLRDGLVDFRIGNLVGKLEFEHHELEAMQKGLDKAGISMPNFSGMSQNFGAEPEPPPEPKESEEDRIQRELHDQEELIFELQAQARGAIQRLRLGDVMQDFWEHEDSLIQLQSRIRGDFARQISNYRLHMKTFSVGLQSVARGHLVRSRQQQRSSHWKARESDIVTIQSLIRARKCRQHRQHIQVRMQSHASGIKSIQAAIRGARSRWSLSDHVDETRKHEPVVLDLQRHIRGALARMQHAERRTATKRSEDDIIRLQARIRGMLERKTQRCDRAALKNLSKDIVKLQSVIRASHIQTRHQRVAEGVRSFESSWRSLQANVRARRARIKTSSIRHELESHRHLVTRLQAALRAQHVRQAIAADRTKLCASAESITSLQSVVRGYLCRRRVQNDTQKLQACLLGIKQLQAVSRAFCLRTRVYDQLCSFTEHEPAMVELQSALRAIALRAHLSDQLEQLDAQEDMIVALQAEARAGLVRKEFVEKKRFYNENMKKVVKIQSFVRGRQQGEAYKSLTSGKNPPVSTVKNFVHLLNDSDFDFDEELEVEKLRKAVGSRARDIEQTEQWITELDAKIGLLAHNKIARDEISRITKQYGNQQLSRGMSTKETFNLKALNKTARAKLELYQQLFVILQTQTIYLARLFKRYREKGASEEEYKRLEMLTISSYGYAQKRREEYYLLGLISSAIHEEAHTCPGLLDFQRGNYFFTRLFSNYARAPRDRKYVREVIGPLLRTQILENAGLDLESDPLQIYRAIINDEELRTGHQSFRSPDVPREQAIKDPETRENFIRHLQDMRDVVDQFLVVMEESMNRMPYGARYITRQMFDILCERYPQDDESVILQLVGNWLWKTYLKPAIADPEKSGAVDRAIESQQRRNMSEFVKVVSQVCAGKLFGDDNVYLQPLNSYMEEAIGRLLDIWAKLIDVPNAESHFEIDVMDDIHAKSPPTLYIKMSDVFAVHQIVAENVSSLCQSRDDAELRDTVRDLGSARSNEAEMSAGSSEVTLTLSARLHDNADPDADVKALFMETKRCILYIIRVQSGGSLMEIMVKAITEDDLARWDAIVSEELAAGTRNTANGTHRRGRAYTDAAASIASNSNLADLAAMSYPELKGIALENILALETQGRVTRSNGYQDLLNDIAIDIRQKHKRRVQRQREADNVRATLAALDEKAAWANEKLEAYNNTFEQNLNVLQNKKGKKRFLMPFSVQWNHERELEKLGRTPRYGSFKYRAIALHEKQILREWRGRDLRDLDVTIASDEVNVFTIEGSSGSLMLPGASATFTWDDLLEAQYQGQSVLRFFGGGSGGGGNRAGGGELVLDAKLFMQQVSKKFWPEG